MPQIAQQDYIVIKPKEGRAANVDAECLRRLKQACENGTIFDCLVGNILMNEGAIDRVLGFYEDGTLIRVSDVANNEDGLIELPYTVEQYSGLAAVQNAVDETIEVMTQLPELHNANGYLWDNTSGEIIGVNGYKLAVTASGGILTALEISDVELGDDDDFVNIAWEDALKLVGLPLV